MNVEVNDQVAVLQSSSTEACFANAAFVAALLTECAVMPFGTGLFNTLYASTIQDFTVRLIAVLDIFLPLLGGEMLTNKDSVNLKVSVCSKKAFKTLHTSRLCQDFSIGSCGFGQNEGRKELHRLVNEGT